MTKITKIKTEYGEFQSYENADLEAVVEQMRSDDTKDAASRVATVALNSRLAMAQGTPRYVIGDANDLPYLVFSTTFSKRGFDHPASFTQLLLLDIPCPDGARQVAEVKACVAQLPYTLLAFAGVSGVTLKVVVRCQYKDNVKPWKPAGRCRR